MQIGDGALSYTVGLALILASFISACADPPAPDPNLWRKHRMLVKELRSVDPEQIDPANEGKLVHCCAMTTSTDVLQDPVFGISRPDALRLKRVVEMYQWREKKERIYHSRSNPGWKYSYDRVWDTRLISSKRFKEKVYENPPTMPMDNQIFDAKGVHMGKFQLLDAQVRRFHHWLPLPPNTITKLPEGGVKEDGYVVFRKKAPPKFYVGDYRVKHYVAPLTEASMLGRQRGIHVVPFRNADGNLSFQVEKGKHTRMKLMDACAPSKR